MARKDKILSALEVIHAALKPMKPEERQRVLVSVNALLGASSSVQLPPKTSSGGSSSASGSSAPSRPLAIRELIQDKHPKSHPQFITLFAYYREKYQSQPTFSRDALEKYYSDSREAPPANYDRDFVAAIDKGWIHEDGENSYITSKGIEAVETAFSRESEGTAGKQKLKSGPKAKSGKKQRKK